MGHGGAQGWGALPVQGLECHQEAIAQRGHGTGRECKALAGQSLADLLALEVAELRSAIVPQLEGLGLLEPRPGAGELEPRLTLAFDREGWSPQLFAQLQARGIACVTWRKGPQQERWLDAEFRAAEIPLRTPFGQESGRGCIAERAMTLLQSKLTVR